MRSGRCVGCSLLSYRDISSSKCSVMDFLFFDVHFLDACPALSCDAKCKVVMLSTSVSFRRTAGTRYCANAEAGGCC
jgi:hypothetical protein